ncbi:MAG: hypothetical protein OEX77_01260 [Candidatus Bathyarchaeota archaeon]|nr:hypothetical protein [Candidatus Bathyarchaeota archaeon]MDH5732756.1 hypothetical protein [Candidatus Bathyarchaeota archaeon]
MALRDYLHEKAEESRHNETLGFLILIIGVSFFIGGIVVTVVTEENPEWLLFIPYKLDSHPYSLIGLSFASIGLVLLILGIIFSIHSALQRASYMDRLKETQTLEAQKIDSEES